MKAAAEDPKEVDPGLAYQLGELAIALDPTRPEHLLPSLAGARVGVVDVGCGVGQLFVAKSDELATGVAAWGFDIDRAAIAYAQRHWPERGRFAVAPAEALPLPDGAVDLYVARVSLPYADIPASLREAARVLVPGGRLWITLHSAAMVFAELRAALRRARLREFARKGVVLANGALFHLFGGGRRLLGVSDSWQSVARMRRELARDFVDLQVRTGRYLLIEARRRGGAD